MRIRKQLLFAVAALLGAATVVLPAIASSETSPTVSAVTYEYLGKIRHYWTPETAHIGEGGAVKFANPSAEVPHGLKFTGGPATPSCTGVPPAAGEATGATGWQGECSFAKSGTYTFLCTVHPTEMTGTVIVSAAGVTTETTTTPTGTSTGSSTPAPPSPGEPKGTVTLLQGSAAVAVAVPRSQRGHTVRGSLALAPAAAGGTLVVEALAPRASLAAAAGTRQVIVGTLRRYYLASGRVAFVVGLNARARRALHRRHRLALALHIRLSAPGGSALTVSRQVTLHG